MNNIMDNIISIIIVSYNRFEETTGPCVASLMADSQNRDRDIIVVDNASADGTADRVRELGDTYPNVRTILNTDNRGFAGGNNDGAAISKGAWLLLLNSDTVVPSGAIGRLEAWMAAHPEWAMLGPVTNQAGNEQKIFTSGSFMESIIEEGQRWCRYSTDDFFPSRRLDFFCVGIRRDLYAAMDGLDERFGAGYYEDTDFSLRVMQAGGIMMVVEDVFVYHQAGQSFASQGKPSVTRLMRSNRKRLYEKHGGRVPLAHMRDCNLDMIAYYVKLLSSGTERCSDMQFKARRRLALADGMMPNSPLKRWKYRRRIRNLTESMNHLCGD
jgi:GT2 family glycosyltransferase